MERHDHHAISKNAVGVKVPRLLSIRFRVFLSVFLLLFFSLVFAGLFARISLTSSRQMQGIVSFQSSFYQSFNQPSVLLNALSGYLNTQNEDDLSAYEAMEESLRDSLVALREASLGPYVEDMAQMYDKLLQNTQAAILYAQDKETALMLSAYQEAERIGDLISSLNAYVTREVELEILSRIDAVTQAAQHAVRSYTLLMISVMALLLCVVARIISSFLRPLYALTDSIRNVTTVDFTNQTLRDMDRKDEMGILIRAFQEMLSRIHHQIEELQQKQQVELELQQEKQKSIQTEAMLAKSELRFYQSQINSHFLFNALNTVSRLAYIENAPQVQHAIALIAQFLRDILSQFDRIIPIGEEFDIVSNYLEIQKLRFGSKICIESALDVDVEWFSIPALTLQPLVENAFRHGLADCRQGFIRYAAEKEGDSVVLSVWDDGKGISPERQESVLDYILHGSDDTSAHSCIGLRNVYRRLEYLYPGRVTPQIESVPGEYTRISFSIA